MGYPIKRQQWWQYLYYILFGLASVGLLVYYLSYTVLYQTTPQQFPVNSFERFPLTWIIFPAEVFSLLFAVYFVYVLLTDRFRAAAPKPLKDKRGTSVAVLLPVYHEPEEIVERTLQAVGKLRWPGKVSTYLLDDSSEKASKDAMQRLARKYRAVYVDRPTKPEGKKAGNINYAIANVVEEDYFVVLDADQAPFPEFLERTMDYLSEPSVGFVQTPQYFIEERTPLERAVKIFNNIFYQSQGVSKARDGAMPFCGTNVVVRTRAFTDVGGFSYYTATEDIDLGLRMNDKGWFGAYVPEVLVEGYAPPDFKAYVTQQYRWANGNLAILRENFLRLFSGRFSFRHQVHTFFTLGWWLIGLVSLSFVLVPVLSLWLGLGTHHTWLSTAFLVLLYINVVFGIGIIYVSLRGRMDKDPVTLKDALLQYSLLVNSMFIYSKAAFNALFKRYVSFQVTDKRGADSGLGLIKLNLLLGAVTFASSVYALYNGMLAQTAIQMRTFLPVSVWLLFYSVVLFSSVLFVGERAPATAPQAATAPAEQKRGATA